MRTNDTTNGTDPEDLSPIEHANDAADFDDAKARCEASVQGVSLLLFDIRDGLIRQKRTHDLRQFAAVLDDIHAALLENATRKRKGI